MFLLVPCCDRDLVYSPPNSKTCTRPKKITSPENRPGPKKMHVIFPNNPFSGVRGSTGTKLRFVVFSAPKKRAVSHIPIFFSGEKIWLGTASLCAGSQGWIEAVHRKLGANKTNLGGGFEYVLFSPLLYLGKWFNLTTIFQRVYWNHQLETYPDTQWRIMAGQSITTCSRRVVTLNCGERYCNPPKIS